MSDETLCERLAAYASGRRCGPSRERRKAQDVIRHNLAVAFGGVGRKQSTRRRLAEARRDRQRSWAESA